MSNNFNPQKVAHFKSKFAKPINNAQPTPQAPPALAAPAPQQAHSQAPAQSHVPVQPQAPAQSQPAPAQPQVIPPQPATASASVTGQPATASADGSKTSRILMGVSALILVAALAVGGTYLFMRNDDGTVSSQGTATEDQPATGDEDQPATGPDQASLADDETVEDGADDSGTSDDSDYSGTSGTSNEENLDQKVEDDKVVFKQNLIGKWVPQIASKKVGMEADGKVWDADAIYEEHQELANEYGTSQVLLLKSEDYASYRQPGYYVTVIDSSYDNPDDALQWCTFHSLDADHCYAKQINTTGGPDGTTRLQK